MHASCPDLHHLSGFVLNSFDSFRPDAFDRGVLEKDTLEI